MPALPPHKAGVEPDVRSLSEILRASGISLSSAQTGQLWKYHELLRQHNRVLNLTRIHNFHSMVRKLYIDSILPGQIISLPSPLMDLGSGAGMPGIPLKIANPGLEIILAESRGNRVEFLNIVLRELGIRKIGIHGHSVSHATEVQVNGIITRAVETIHKTLERITGCLSLGGSAIFMKGPECDGEIEEALDKLGRQFRLTADHHYRLPHSTDERRLVVFERLDSPPWARKAKFAKDNLVRIIESDNNETYRDLKKLLTPRGIRKQNQGLVFGQKQVLEVLNELPGRCIAWISRLDKNPPPEDSPGHLLWYQLAPPLFDSLDLFGTSHPIVLVKIDEMPRWSPSDGLPEGCTLLIPFQDPENVGAAIRSAVAFGAAAIILLAEAANPFHPKSVRASGGAVFRAKMLEGPSIMELPDDMPLVTLSNEGRTISDFKFPARFGLLPGIEGPGLPDRFRAESVSIPISPQVESLNATVATAIALFKWAEAAAGGK